MLNDRQKLFALEYLKDRNATAAAIRAGYSEKTATSQGERLLRHADVVALIAAKDEVIHNRLEVTAERVQAEMARIAFGDIRKLFDQDGRLKPIHTLDDDTATLLASVDLVTIPDGDGAVMEVRKIKQWDKPKALEQLARILSMFKDKVEHVITDDLGDRMARARAAAAQGVDRE